MFRHIEALVFFGEKMHTQWNWSKATPVRQISSDEPRRFLSRGTIPLRRTLERAEIAALETRIVALKEINEVLVKQLDEVRRERDNLLSPVARDRKQLAHFTNHVLA